jgi:hypothetical protein
MTYTITATLELPHGSFSTHRTAEEHDVLDVAWYTALDAAKPWHFKKPDVRLVITCDHTGETLYDGVLSDPWGWVPL